MNNFDPESDYPAQPAEIPSEPGAEPVLAGAATPAPEGAALTPPGAPASDTHAFRWVELAYVVAFYFVAGAVLGYLTLVATAAIYHTTVKGLKDIPTAYAAAVTISTVLLSLALLAFLWLLVRSRGTAPFWPALGWRPFSSAMPHPALALRCILGGATLAVVTQGASYYANPKSSVPIEDLFRDRPSVLMMMALGILVAPLIEETLFRGCIYPVLERTLGAAVSVFLAGTLFGLSHGPQLGWEWKQVSLVCVVGVVLTYVRARTGTVLASFLVHFGYNSFLFGAFYVATGGLRNFPGS